MASTRTQEEYYTKTVIPYLKSAEQVLRQLFINNTIYNNDARNAALTAISAIQYLYEPAEEITVVRKKKSWNEFKEERGI